VRSTIIHPLSADQLLHVWELVQARSPVQRALTLLAAACPDSAPDALADLSIGQRNLRLLRLRALTFGTELTCFAVCPRCSGQAELTFDVDDITVETIAEPAATVTVWSKEFVVEARVPTSRDLLAVADSGDVTSIRHRLLDRCIMSAHYHAEPVTTASLPENVIAAIGQHIAEADVHAEIRLTLTCPACRHPWEELFDVLTYVLIEIDAWANRLLRDVHDLASTYGWREADILAMNPIRRRRYLTMVDA
jgi:hypothetical protein